MGFVALLKNPVHLFAFGLGSGLAPYAPGTAGTVAAVLIYALLPEFSLEINLLIIFASFLLGVYLCGKTAVDLGVHDHSGIVWDEWVGYFITVIWFPKQWPWLVAGFILFRFFDIVKPWPISWLDRQVDGGLGIMLDDVLAGIFAALVLLFISPYL
ncbi:MAG: phosphatidylglycerophosphatase A [Gammaproteobacteria bacterium]|nr:phosphatidylglycerophosphatase A [Gammaproteobacteria bacterium]